MHVVLFVCSRCCVSLSLLLHTNPAAAAELHPRANVTRGSASPPHTTAHVYLKHLLFSVSPPLAVAKQLLITAAGTLKVTAGLQPWERDRYMRMYTYIQRQIHILHSWPSHCEQFF